MVQEIFETPDREAIMVDNASAEAKSKCAEMLVRLIERFERRYWERLLARTEGNLSAAAREAGIHRKSAEYLLKKLDLKAIKEP